jgi:alkanesulfonate monooxygenase SsuD/methylene tetrahydromethanopterin reductase-like flavin-dependent oxidoreductase (luciferase family)
VTERVQLASGIMQVYPRTLTMTAMTAAGLDYVSGGRFTLGIGASGPQVTEGWHGVPYDAPVARTRELIEICRRVWRRERLGFQGEHYQIPLPSGQGTGLGKPLRLINHPVRPAIPIIVAALGPKNVEMTAGGMGARGKNFYTTLATRYGYGREAAAIQDSYLAGRKDQDAGLVPLELLDGGSLVGSRSYVAERLAALREAGVTTLNVTPMAATHAERLALVEQVREFAS